jgi:hypothetical protein
MIPFAQATRSQSPALARVTRRLLLAALATILLLTTSPSLAAPGNLAINVPVLAYYYIWFTPNSWARAKRDLPSLGRYSSDDTEVMRQHIRWAKSAGINGFLVSWKNTPSLTSRLHRLVSVANSEQFKLSIIYQGLDFDRQPLPVDQIAADLDFFINNFAADPAFSMFSKPLVIWSGTWKFSPDAIAGVTANRRAQLLILASERNENEYMRLANLVDGDAYYWSSIDPDVDRGFGDKLARMAQRIHQQAGMWIAPAAPGFDARLIGGTRNVDRKDGETLRTELAAAASASPDAIGLISWNEFSENSHIEPSQGFGTRYLDVLASLLGGGVGAPTTVQVPASPDIPTPLDAPVPAVDTTAPPSEPALDAPPPPDVMVLPSDEPPPQDGPSSDAVPEQSFDVR